MAGPITWRNVESRGAGDAAQLLRDAQGSLSSGVNQLGNIFDDRQALEKRNLDNQKDLNTQAFLDRLNSFGDLGSLEENQAGIQDFAAGLGPNVDREVVRTGFDDRVNKLRTDLTADQEFEDAQSAEAVEPLMENIRQLMVSDPAAAQQAIEGNRDALAQANQLGNLQGSLDTRLREVADREWTDWRRDTERTNYDSETNSQEALRRAILSSENEIDARNEFQRLGSELGIKDEDLNTRLAELPGLFNSMNDLSVDQKRQVLAQQNTAEAQAGFLRTEAEQMRDLVYEENKIDPRYSFSESDRPTLASAIRTGEELGFDKNAWGSADLKTAVTTVFNDFVEQNGIPDNKFDSEGQPITDEAGNPVEVDSSTVEALLNVAIDELGTAEGIFGSTENLSKKQLREALNRAYTNYSRELSARRNRIVADEEFARSSAAADAFAGEAVNDYYERLLGENRLRRQQSRNQ